MALTVVDSASVSACLVTRGDVDLTEILESLPFDDVTVWDNRLRDDLGIFGRYAAIAEARHDLIYTQDDDVIVENFDELVRRFRTNRMIVNVDPETWEGEPDLPWVGKGAIFHKRMVRKAFQRLATDDRIFTHQTCDVYMGMLTPFERIVGGYRNLPHANAPGRVSTVDEWWSIRAAAKAHALLIRGEIAGTVS